MYRELIRARIWTGVAAVALVFLPTASMYAQPFGPFFSRTGEIPNGNEAIEGGATFPGGHTLGWYIHFVRPQIGTIPATPPNPGFGNSFASDSFYDITEFIIMYDGKPYNGDQNPVVIVHVSGTDNLPNTSTFQTQILQLVETIQFPVMIRISPTLQSTGQTQITDVGGRYQLESFYNIFSELSVDGGNTWLPADGPALMQSLVPEPTSIVLAATGLIGLLLVRRNKLKPTK
jgi:hypothetical protein